MIVGKLVNAILGDVAGVGNYAGWGAQKPVVGSERVVGCEGQKPVVAWQGQKPVVAW